MGSDSIHVARFWSVHLTGSTQVTQTSEMGFKALVTELRPKLTGSDRRGYRQKVKETRARTFGDKHDRDETSSHF